MSDPIVAIEPSFVRVSGKTIWIFVRLRTKSGLEGWGEATLGGYEGAVHAFLRDAASWLIGQDSGALNALAIAYCLLPCLLKMLAAVCLYVLVIRPGRKESST